MLKSSVTSLSCSSLQDDAGPCDVWTDGARALLEVPTKCLNSCRKIPRLHVPEVCTLVSQFVLILENLSQSLHHVSVSRLYSHHLLATVYESKGELRLALQHKKEAHLIYNKQVSLKVQLRWCLCVHDLASASFHLHTHRLVRTVTGRRRAGSTCRASLSRLWCFRRPSARATASHQMSVHLS